MSDKLTEDDLRSYTVTYAGETSEKLKAAYFVQDEALIVFKNHDHKVIFAARRDMVVSVRDTTEEQACAGAPSGRDDPLGTAHLVCGRCGGPTWCDHTEKVATS